MYIDGILRSEVDFEELRPWGLGEPEHFSADRNCNWCQDGGFELDTNYKICIVSEWPMGEVVIGGECTDRSSPGATDRTVLYNVLMQFQSLAYPETGALGESCC